MIPRTVPRAGLLLRHLTTTTCASSSPTESQPPSPLRHATVVTYHRAARVLEVELSDETHRFSAELLRIASPSAEMRRWRAAMGDANADDGGKVVAGRKGIGITRVDAVGSYAVRLTFDDLHDTGIYSWDYLVKLSRTRRAVARAYLEALRARGLTRLD
jgi:DUF971 family protein